MWETNTNLRQLYFKSKINVIKNAHRLEEKMDLYAYKITFCVCAKEENNSFTEHLITPLEKVTDIHIWDNFISEQNHVK